MIHKIALILTLLYVISNQLFAQDALYVNPESNIIEGSFIEPYTNKWQVSINDTNGNKSTVRIWTDYAQILEIDGVDYLHRVQDLYSSNLELEETWINIVSHHDLFPKRFTSQNASGGLLNIKFEAGKLTIKSNAESQKFDPEIVNLSQPVYDWNLYGMLLVGLPFNEGKVYRIPYWSQSTRSVDYVVTTINEKETIKTLSG
ncbi:MAG: hypothetical protein WDZ80_04515, partial [Candidatus Paceibacterota bacterium]